MQVRSKLLIFVFVVAIAALAGVSAYGQCLTIQSGLLKDANGNAITTGYDQYGYNYQAHMYNGLYANYTRPAVPYTEETCGTVAGGCDTLQMKWNDAWLSNQSCDSPNDYKLDRYFGFPSYIGSGAWLTNHQLGSYSLPIDGKEKTIHWTYFVKIVAVPGDALRCGGNWCTADGTEIGPAIWGAFAIIQEVYNDPGAAAHGISYKSPAGPGWGIYGNN